MTKLVIAITIANVLSYVAINHLKHVKKQAILSMVGKAWETSTWIWETTLKPITKITIGFILFFAVVIAVSIATI